MLFSSLFVSYVEFPNSNNAIFKHSDKNNIEIETSGSIGFFYSGKCHYTSGNETLSPDEFSDWCSNIVADQKDKKLSPFIQYSLKDKQLKVTKYSVRNGCCNYACCCDEDDSVVNNGDCCCQLYSYSLIASNDKRVWTTLHKVEKDNNFYGCLTKTFDINKNEAPYTYYRFVLDEQYPECLRCLQINQLELYGEVMKNKNDYDEFSNDDDDSISIIGRIRRNE